MIIGILPKNISKVHQKIADILRERSHKVYLEYPVRKLLLNFWENSKVPYHDRDIKLLAEIRELSFDFYNETTQTIIEVQGSQHHKFVPFFHSNLGDFDIQKINDKLKVRVCREVDITLSTISSDTKENLEEFLKNI